jgi:DNA-binding response OmpR family regulator
MKALIVEDEPLLAELVSSFMKDHWPGVEIIAADKGEDGVVAVEAESPDVVILDIGLPDIDGWQVLKRLRAFSDVPVVVLTARTGDEDMAAFLSGGAQDYVSKPFNASALLASIERVLGHT